MGWPGLIGVGLLAVSLALSSAVSGERRWNLILACGVLIFASVGAGRSPRSDPPALVGITDAPAVRGTVHGGVTRAGGRQRYILETDAIQGPGGEWHTARITLRVNAPGLPEVRSGDLIRVDGRLAPLEAQPASYRSYLAKRDIAGTYSARAALVVERGRTYLHVFEAVRWRMDAVLQGAVPGDTGALLAGLVTGDDESLSAGRRDAFLVAGLSHITVISGSNIALLTTVLVGRRANTARQRKRWLMLLVVTSIWSYALIVQLEPPVVRASLMATLALVGVRLGRRVDYVSLTIVSAVAMVMVEPGHVRGLAFQLSFVSATALVLMVQADERQSVRAQMGRAIVSVAAAQLAVLPFVLPMQNQLSMTALPANVIVGPLAAIAFAIGLLAALIGLIWLPAGSALAATGGLIAEAILRIVDVLGRPGAVVPLWSLSPQTVSVIGIVTVGLLWALSSEGRRVFRHWRHAWVTRNGRAGAR